MVLFARDISDPNQSNVFEMQTMWFENESGEAYAAHGDYGRALKVRFYSIRFALHMHIYVTERKWTEKE